MIIKHTLSCVIFSAGLIGILLSVKAQKSAVNKADQVSTILAGACLMLFAILGELINTNELPTAYDIPKTLIGGVGLGLSANMFLSRRFRKSVAANLE